MPTRRSARPARVEASSATSRVLPAPGGDGTTTAGSPDQAECSTPAVTGSSKIAAGGCRGGGAGTGAGAACAVGAGAGGVSMGMVRTMVLLRSGRLGPGHEHVERHGAAGRGRGAARGQPRAARGVQRAVGAAAFL